MQPAKVELMKLQKEMTLEQFNQQYPSSIPIAELAIIISVQEGLASKLDMQAIYDLVGDKIRGMKRSTPCSMSSCWP